ncbi:protein-lysine N-trimethyltransferase SMYD5 [Lepeophtheirus salmonis]|uniref:protein-lysine N-trimethyltransferase SMYD5 n=1 Tax=Lepeophtheirus salmonis TaxID=72036 RepID=UPI001AE17ED0|nr:SET and MYND domain-containing protein 5-like [Lepeophtheirus salmonis]
MNQDYSIIKINDEVGHGLVALRRFREGETILREKPLVSSQFSWNRQYGYAACAFCLTPLETAQENIFRLTDDPNILLPHTQCCETRSGFHSACPECNERYCSTHCLEEDAKAQHALLCQNQPLKDLEELWKGMHYPPESCSITLMAKILARLCLHSDHFSHVLSRFCQDPIVGQEMTHKLLGQKYASQLECLREATLRVFSSKPEVAPYLTSDGFIRLFALVARNGQGIGSSPFGRWVKNVEKLRFPSENEKAGFDNLIENIFTVLDRTVGLDFLNSEGSGLYELQSASNHSCEPNAVIEFPFNNFELVLNAKKDINEGEEICISYLDECMLESSRHSRRKYLKENYMFLCKCIKCEAQINDPDVTSEEEMSSDENEN